jgi:phage replication-related protein YjqB (UPF0714/DUF867 family)
MNILTPANDTYLQARLAALEVDLSSALAISNALLFGLTATGPRMHHAIDAALDEALRLIAVEDRDGAAEVHAIVSEIREKLRGGTDLKARMAQDLERLIINKAFASAADGGAVVENFDSRKPG